MVNVVLAGLGKPWGGILGALPPNPQKFWRRKYKAVTSINRMCKGIKNDCGQTFQLCIPCYRAALFSASWNDGPDFTFKSFDAYIIYSYTQLKALFAIAIGYLSDQTSLGKGTIVNLGLHIRCVASLELTTEKLQTDSIAPRTSGSGEPDGRIAVYAKTQRIAKV